LLFGGRASAVGVGDGSARALFVFFGLERGGREMALACGGGGDV
jgi:hypothetical protein